MVVLPTSGCAAAAMCRNTKYLSKDAPRLPLAGCSHPESCQCKYRHFEDRRSGVRRGNEVGVSSADRPKEERRKLRGRRARDKV